MSRPVSAVPSSPEQIVARLHAPASAPPGYQLHRVILCNYWHFGLLTFEIPHGRLFLTGDNATGKSTALVAAMLTLDGDVRPHRLDTFGTAERQIAAYVLGTRSAANGGAYEHASRTSLVATEWAWHGQPDAEHPPYLTLGLTFVGNAGNADPVRTWRFLLLDGARLDKDIDFLDTSGRLLDARTLRTRLGAHGQVHDRVEAYKTQVAQHLFGFRDRRDMDRLIDWLLLLRKPNLTSRLSSFSEVTEFLRQALPPLPTESTLQLTQTFDHLVALRQALDERLAVAEAVDRILQEQQAQRLALARLRAYDVRDVGLVRQRAAARLKDKRHLAARLERELATAERSLEQSQNEVAELDDQIRRLEASAEIRGSAAIRARLARAEADAARIEQTVQRQRAVLDEAEAHAKAVQQVIAQLGSDLSIDRDHPPSPPVRLETLLQDLHDQALHLVQMLVEAFAEAQHQHAQAQADVETFRAQLAQRDASETMRELDRAREARRAAEELLRAADRQVGVLTSRCDDARLMLAEVETSATEADRHEETAAAALAAVVDGDPEPTLEEAAQYLHQSDSLAAADALLGGSPPDRASLERACTTARDRFVRVFAERRPMLAELQPCIEDDAVRVRCGDRLLGLSAFRPELEEEIARRRALITEEEEQLFTAFLLDGAAGQIGEAIRRAEAWVEGINAVLARIPLVHERYVLELRPGHHLSGPLARHYGLFRTAPDALSSQQRQSLLEALREATAEAQRRHEQDGAEFVDELERMLDYRDWLRLEVAVIGASGQRVVLTDRVAKTRSGAEQMMAQYVPLFAALSALYDLAAPWAPRLLALDEAFDKASDESSQQMLRFLVGQGFQWLMTSPRLTGQGSAVPAYAEYLMVHERASRKAFGIPFFAETLADQSSAA